MSDTRVLAADPVELLKQDHDRLRILFRKYAQTAAANVEARDALFRRIRHDLRIHDVIEREYFYPMLSPGLSSLQDDHAAMEGLLEKLSGMSGGDRSTGALVRLLEENFNLHAAAEERDCFPRLRKLPSFDQYELTLRLETARAEMEGADGSPGVS